MACSRLLQRNMLENYAVMQKKAYVTGMRLLHDYVNRYVNNR